ncbi:Hypothetical predicted protein, partial [Paramuricea clavata]
MLAEEMKEKLQQAYQESDESVTGVVKCAIVLESGSSNVNVLISELVVLITNILVNLQVCMSAMEYVPLHSLRVQWNKTGPQSLGARGNLPPPPLGGPAYCTSSKAGGEGSCMKSELFPYLTGSSCEKWKDQLLSLNHRFMFKKVYRNLGIVEMKLNEVSSGSVTSVVNIAGTPVQQTSGSVRVKLPKLEVKKFKGSVFEWQEFWDAFESSIHTNVGLSDVDKFSYLKGLVEEPAKSAISGFSLTAANYGSAVELLKRRFGKPVTIQRAHINELLNLQGVYKERETGRLRALYDKIECHYRGLVALKVGEATGADFKNWTMTDLLDQFRVELELREEAVVLVPNDGRQSGYGKRDRNVYTNSALFAGWGKGVCAFCRGSHNHEACQKVKDTREHKGHLARNCMNKVVCNSCKGQHHTALCEKKNTERDDDKEGTSCRIALQTAQALVKGERQRRKAKETEVREVVRVDVNPLGSGKVLTLEAYVVPTLTKARMTRSYNCGIWIVWVLRRRTRMKSQVKRLRKQPDILVEYDNIIKQQLDAGVIERVPELDTAEKVHYLPHQAV